MIRVIVRDKSKWQKDDCLFCKNNSTLEAVVFKPVQTLIRMCESKKCIDKAKKMAREHSQIFSSI